MVLRHVEVQCIVGCREITQRFKRKERKRNAR
jgi:hypothetical protein